jgi:sensor histidine kinase YesM
MKQAIPQKKLFRIAIYTSTAIGLITIGPAYIIGITLGNISFTGSIVFQLLSLSVIGISTFVFLIWMLNIALLTYFNKGTILSGKKYTRYLTSFLVCFMLMLIIRISVEPIVQDTELTERLLQWKLKKLGIQAGDFNYMQYTKGWFQFLIAVFAITSINTVVLIIQDMVMLNERKMKIEWENNLLKIKNMEAANQKLKQQLQPHFLFNSLNVLKTLIRKQPEDAEAYLKRLSDFLRASVTFDDADTVRFEEELKLSLDYMEMQKIRFGQAIHFETDIPEEAKVGFLPLFSLQLLLENAIKHNAFTAEMPLHIKMYYHDGRITVSNTIRKKKSEDSTTGVGLANLSERYRLLSGEDIQIRSTDTDFTVSIKILSK